MEELFGVKDEALLKRIASHLATEWKEPYTHTCGYVKSRVVITIVMANYCCIRGTRVTASQISVTRPQQEDGASLHIFR